MIPLHGRTLPSPMAARMSVLTRARLSVWQPAGEKSKFFLADRIEGIMTDSANPASIILVTSALVRVCPVAPGVVPAADWRGRSVAPAVACPPFFGRALLFDCDGTGEPVPGPVANCVAPLVALAGAPLTLEFCEAGGTSSP